MLAFGGAWQWWTQVADAATIAGSRADPRSPPIISREELHDRDGHGDGNARCRDEAEQSAQEPALHPGRAPDVQEQEDHREDEPRDDGGRGGEIAAERNRAAVVPAHGGVENVGADQGEG